MKLVSQSISSVNGCLKRYVGIPDQACFMMPPPIIARMQPMADNLETKRKPLTEGARTSPDADRDHDHDRRGDSERRSNQCCSSCGYHVNPARHSRQFGSTGDLDSLRFGECRRHAVGRRTGWSARDRTARCRRCYRKSSPATTCIVRPRKYGIGFGGLSLPCLGTGHGLAGSWFAT